MKTLLSSTIIPAPNALFEDQIRQFQNDGYLAFTDVLSTDEVHLSREALTRSARDFIQNKSTIYTAAKGTGNMGGAWYKRPENSPGMLSSRMHLEPGFDPVGKSPEEIELNVRKFMYFLTEDPIFQKMVAPGSNIYRIIESILGPNPILFQEMALVKPPFVGSEKPWHQDNAYFSVAPLDRVIGVWVALDDAEVDNGCMHVIPGGHKDGAFQHHHGTDCEIDPQLLATERATPVPIPAGGAMFFYGMLPHETPPNRSPKRRRALQFHFRAADTQIVDEEAYNRLFVNRDGTPASCRVAVRAKK